MTVPTNPALDVQHRQALARYCAAERADPFTWLRGLTHLANGVAGYRPVPPQAGEPAFYDARGFPETRVTFDGRSFTVLDFRQRTRP